ncbi:hypothetical protein [Streptomyces xanthii]|uniref:Uncharacterized protein n=1 Tax=Streptomyces xanthii TaxID=2768069 RepID=A0A7H1BKT8_9ACTN|nr:hypothetical protein [Streptomyces xanthii]QNS09343.1 hypothetical protein IAG42_36990 [Streptomyces xanthii]
MTVAERGSDGRAGQLIDAWDEMREYVDHDPQEYERLVAECARELAAAPSGTLAYRWTLGLVLALPYLATRKPEDLDVEAAFGAASAAARALRDETCGHGEHPFQGSLEGQLECVPDVLRELGGEGAGGEGLWPDPRQSREAWLCPRNTAGYARVVMESLRPGSAGDDVPPFLPFEDRYELDGLTAIMEGYPLARTFDVAFDLSFAASALQEASGEDLAGRVFTATAVTWYVEVEADPEHEGAQQLVAELVGAFERALELLSDGGTCAHDAHPALPDDATEVLWVGAHLASARGRAVYERWPRKGVPPLGTVRCPVFVAATVRDSLARLRSC